MESGRSCVRAAPQAGRVSTIEGPPSGVSWPSSTMEPVVTGQRLINRRLEFWKHVRGICWRPVRRCGSAPQGKLFSPRAEQHADQPGWRPITVSAERCMIIRLHIRAARLLHSGALCRIKDDSKIGPPLKPVVLPSRTAPRGIDGPNGSTCR
jgi:hypothetical protein